MCNGYVDASCVRAIGENLKTKYIHWVCSICRSILTTKTEDHYNYSEETRHWCDKCRCYSMNFIHGIHNSEPKKPETWDELNKRQDAEFEAVEK
jgi:hypothetical protein